MNRASWDDTWIAVAQVMAKRSLCSRDQVGAVIVDRTNRIVATSYNGAPANFDPGAGLQYPALCEEWCARGTFGPTAETAQSYTDCPALHAEANGLSVCDRSLREGGTLYVTSHMCWGCAKLVANSGLTRVVVQPGKSAAYRHSSESYELLRSCSIVVDVHD